MDFKVPISCKTSLCVAVLSSLGLEIDCDHEGFWGLVEKKLAQSLPLRNVPLKPATGAAGASPRPEVLPAVHIAFRPLKADSYQEQDVLSLHEQELVHIFVTCCNAIDTYRQTVRPQLAHWIEKCSVRKDHSLLILLVARADKTDSASDKGNQDFLLDKLKFDFNGTSNAMFLSLALDESSKAGADSVLAALSSAVASSLAEHTVGLEEEIRILSAQRMSANWDFSAFFLLKEAMAFRWLQCGLHGKALLCYEELEVFFQEVAEKHGPTDNLASPFGSHLPKDQVSGTELSTYKFAHAIRERLHRQDVSVYELEVYICSCKLEILSLQGDFKGFLQKLKLFVCFAKCLCFMILDDRQKWVCEAILASIRQLLACWQVDSKESEATKLLVDVLLLLERVISSQDDVAMAKTGLPSDRSLGALIGALMNKDQVTNAVSTRIELLRVCMSLLSENKHSRRSVEVAQLYAQLLRRYGHHGDAYNILAEIVGYPAVLQWQELRLALMESMLECLRHMGRFDELVKLAVELSRFMRERRLSSGHVLSEALSLLGGCDEAVELDLKKYLLLRSLSITEPQDSPSPVLELKIEPQIDLDEILEKASCEVWLMSELGDLRYESSAVRMEGGCITIELSCKSTVFSGSYQLKSLQIHAGAILFSGDFTNAQDTFLLDFSIPAPVSFSIALDQPANEAKLLCQGSIQLHAVQNLTVTLSAADLELHLTKDKGSGHFDQLQADESFILTWSITDYIPGDHNVRVSATWADADGPLRSYSRWHRIILPAPLTASKTVFRLPKMSLIDVGIDASTRPAAASLREISMERGTKVQRMVVDGRTPLHIVAESGEPEEVPLRVKLVDVDDSGTMMMPVISKVTAKTTFLQTSGGECDATALAEFTFDQANWMLAGSLEGTESQGSLMGFPLAAGYLNLPELGLNRHEACHNLSALQRVRVQPAVSSLKATVTM